MTTIYSAARDVATQYPVFPCLPSKRPATKHGFKDAVWSPPEAQALFQAHPEATLIGVPTGSASGLIVIDIDPRHGGQAWYDAHQVRIDETRIHSTMSGGLHLVFTYLGDDIRNSASRLAPGVDVRGEGGYVIWPPSPGYAIAHDVEPAPLPEWLRSLLLRAPERPAPSEYKVPRFTEGGSPYGLKALEQACQAIGSAPDGAKHETLNRQAYSIGGLVGAGHIDEGHARQALAAALNHLLPRCDDQDAARRTLAEAFRDGLARPRIIEEATPISPRQVHWDATDGDDFGLVEEEAKPVEDEALPVVDAFDFNEAAIPPRPWVVPGLLLRGHVTLLAGAGGSGKSLFTLQLGCAIAQGQQWGGFGVRKPSRVLMLNAEDDIDEQRRRLSGIKRIMQIEPGALPGALMLVDNPPDLMIVSRDPATRAAVATPMVKRLVATIRAKKIDVLVVDPFAETIAGDENAAEYIRPVMRIWRDEIAAKTGCAILLVHHTPKASQGMAGNAAAVRGSGAIVAAARSAWTAFAMTQEEAKRFGMDPDEAGRFMRLDDAKANYSLRAGGARWFEKLSIDLQNGPEGESDQVGVLRPWRPAGVLSTVPVEVILNCLDGIARGLVDDDMKPTGRLYCLDKRSDRYVGPYVQEMTGLGKEAADAVIEAWLESGLLEERPWRDPAIRHMRKGLFVDQSKRPG